MNWLYFVLMILTVAGPIAMSFESKINFYSKWKKFLSATILPALFFIIWDIIFTAKGVWSFNPEYYLGYKIFQLPIEEWMFFFFVPFSCIFIVENVLYFTKGKTFSSTPITLALSVILLSLCIIYFDRLYSITTFSLLLVSLLYFEFVKKKDWLGKFYISWLICLIPFFIVNGILTAMPVVLYDNAENMSIRLGTIPFEDGFYGMLLMLLICGYYLEDEETAETGNELFVGS